MLQIRSYGSHAVQVVLVAESGRTMPAFTKNALGIIAYPRTGKRGVPQQFPRRLYEMLQSESKLLKGSSDHEDIIAWSDSGKAFCILDVPMFSTDVLPRYFRTSKFSSFQRNLNLVSASRLSFRSFHRQNVSLTNLGCLFT